MFLLHVEGTQHLLTLPLQQFGSANNFLMNVVPGRQRGHVMCVFCALLLQSDAVIGQRIRMTITRGGVIEFRKRKSCRSGINGCFSYFQLNASSITSSHSVPSQAGLCWARCMSLGCFL